MKVRLELRNKDFELLEILDNEFSGLTWEYNRVGGCGSMQFSLPREYCNERSISGDFNVRLYVRNESTLVYDLWYQGIVENKSPSVGSDKETVSVQVQGYQAQLYRIQLSAVTYSSLDVADIVEDLLDTYIVPNTDITYDIADIETTGFVVDNIKFDTDCLGAIQTLADIVGAREWGVDKDRKFFFKERSSTVAYSLPLGGKIVSFTSDESFRDIVNRVIIQGGDVADVPFVPDYTTAPYNNLQSQLKYGRHDQVYQNSSVVTDQVAEQFAAAILAENSDVIRRAKCDLADYEVRIEESIPIGLFQIVAPGTLYGERLYGTFLYSGRIQFQINRIGYKLEDNDSSSNITLELGQPRPNISEAIGQLRYQLEQLRSASL
jgi:hypothetical protein